MKNALVFILRTLFDLYVLTLALRLLLQWAAVDKRQPAVQFILRVTNPLVIPLRRLLPSIGRIDTATWVVLLGLQMVFSALLVTMNCSGETALWQILALALVGVVKLGVSVLTWTLIIYVVLSWVTGNTYNPGMALVSAMVEPLLAPVRRRVPLIGGLDLSALFVLIGLQALVFLLPPDWAFSSMLCTSFGSSSF